MEVCQRGRGGFENLRPRSTSSLLSLFVFEAEDVSSQLPVPGASMPASLS